MARITARTRMLNPGVFENEELARADPFYTIVFQVLWCLADRQGRLEDRPEKIRGRLLPYRDEGHVLRALDWLSEKGFIVRYTIQGRRFIAVPNFLLYQKTHDKETASTIPPPPAEVEGGREMRTEYHTHTTYVLNTGSSINENTPGDAETRARLGGTLGAPQVPLLPELELTTTPTPPTGSPGAAFPDPPEVKGAGAPWDFERVVLEAWNAAAQRSGLCPCKLIDENLRKKLKAAQADWFWRDYWQAALAKAETIPGLCGQGGRGWRAPLGWFLNVKNHSVGRIMSGELDSWTGPPVDKAAQARAKSIDAAKEREAERQRNRLLCPRCGGRHTIPVPDPACIAGGRWVAPHSTIAIACPDCHGPAALEAYERQVPHWRDVMQLVPPPKSPAR